MTKQKAIPLIEKWIKRGKEAHKAQDDMRKILMTSPEAPIFNAIWNMFDGYTESLSEILDDQDDWLNWFAWECRLGDNPMEMTFKNKEKLLVKDAKDLADVIFADREVCDMEFEIGEFSKNVFGDSKKWYFVHSNSGYLLKDGSLCLACGKEGAFGSRKSAEKAIKNYKQ